MVQTRNIFKGTGVAIVTPFHNDDSIDFKSLSNLVNFQIENKVDYLVVLGTTGESVTISNDEKKAIINTVIGTTNKRVPIVVGIGGNNTQDIINKIRTFDFTGVDAILSVSPYYNKPSQAGIYEHYKIIASISPVPIIIYNIPGRTGSNVSAETTLKLAHDFKNIIATKEASGNLQQIMQIIKNKPDNFEVISGDDALALPLISIGGIGVISVIANAFPRHMSEMINNALKGNYERARELNYAMIDMIGLLFAECSPSGIKAALEIKKLCTSHVRLPLVKVSDSLYQKINEATKLLDSYSIK